jgi:O-antigen/teichoic acid export membrane protein
MSKNLKSSGDSRTRRASLTGVTTLVVRAISVGTSLLSIPITARYLGTEQFGIWLLLNTFINWVAVADFGVVNSLMNVLTTAIAKGDKKTAKESVASAFFSMTFLALLSISIVLFLSQFWDWEKVLNLKLSSSIERDTRLAVIVAICLLAIKLPLSIPRSIYLSFQEGYIHQLWNGLGNILALLSLLIAQQYHANLAVLIGTFFGCILFSDLLSAIHLFYFHQKWLAPKIECFNSEMFIKLLKIGGQFWIAQICSVAIFQTDLIVVSQLFGIGAVASYGVLQKMFSLTESVSAAFILPLWPAYNDARARSDYKWIAKTLRKSLILATIWAICFGVTIAVFSQSIVTNWVDKEIVLPQMLIVMMLLTYVLLPISQCMAMLVNGIGNLKFQSFVAPLSAIGNIGLSIILGNAMGSAGVTLATAICLLVFSIGLVGGECILRVRKEALSMKVT